MRFYQHNMRIKVLIASHKIGAGHKALGDTFYEQLKKDRRFDVKHFIREGGAGDKFYSLYIKYPLFLQEAMSVPQELPFCDIQESIKTPHMFIQSYRILKDENPDIVLSTRFSQTQHFAVAKRILKLPTVIINAVPDYGAPSRKDYPFLNYFKPDYLFVMEKDSLYQAIKKFNIDKQKVINSNRIAKMCNFPMVNSYQSITEIITQHSLRPILNTL